MAWRRMASLVLAAAVAMASAGCALFGADGVARDVLARALEAVAAAEAVEEASGGEEAATGAEEAAGEAAGGAEAVGEAEGGGAAVEESPAAAETAAVPTLRYCWGGFDGSKAKEVAEAQIKGLKVTGDGLRYSWASGGCEKLGASSKTAADCLACLFLEDGRGGKFDWISTSRTSRSFENIMDGYNGWDAAAFRASKKVFFCVVSKDGKKRTNIIEAAK